MEDLFEQEEQLVEPTPTPEVKKKAYKKEEPCKDCPDYTFEDILKEKIFLLKTKGYNDNQIAAMLGVHKQFVETVK